MKKIGVESNQFRLSFTDTLISSDRFNQVNRPRRRRNRKLNKNNELPMPLVETGKPAVEAMRNVLFGAALEQYKLMLQELEKPILKYVSLPSLRRWPLPEQWDWPVGSVQADLYKDLHNALRLLYPYETKKREILRWANYHLWVLTKLSRLDELLRTGNLDEFFRRCHDERGMFALERKHEEDKKIGRTLLTPHWLNRKHEFLALEKEWKKETGQMKKKEKEQIEEPVIK